MEWLRRRIVRALFASLEWRFIALALTAIYVSMVTRASLFETTVFTAGLQAVLFAGHTLWYALKLPDT